MYIKVSVGRVGTDSKLSVFIADKTLVCIRWDEGADSASTELFSSLFDKTHCPWCLLYLSLSLCWRPLVLIFRGEKFKQCHICIVNVVQCKCIIFVFSKTLVLFHVSHSVTLDHLHQSYSSTC